jgi:hypothetical protein
LNRRDGFLQAVASALASHPGEVGPGVVHRVCAEYNASISIRPISVMRAACRSIANPLWWTLTRSVSIQAGTCNHVDMFNALWQKWLSRISGSPKNIALGQLILAILLSFVSGMFLIQGMGVFRGDPVYWIQLIGSPALLVIAIVHARLVWHAIE